MKFLFYIFVFISQLLFSQVVETELNAVWKFRQQNTKPFYPAIVPGTVHTDLLNSHLMKDPFIGANEKELQWIENENWEYVGAFICNTKTLLNKHVELSFEGLDTYATVFLNGTLILESNNMFRAWNVNVKPYLKVGTNNLKIVIESAVNKGKAEATKLPYTLPGDEKVFTRKAQYQYGWDFGPRFVTCGIIKPIKISCWNDLKIESVRHTIKTLNDTFADVEFITTTISDKEQIAHLRVNAYLGDLNVAKLQHNQFYTPNLKKGINVDTIHYSINRPLRWNSNGLGAPNMYGVEFTITNNDKELAQKHLSIGLRTLELVKEKDFFGESFYFKLNGVSVFMKGANYIPPDNFLPRVKPTDYHKIVEMAKDANMNMLRVWGGGVYADDEFYDLCDKSGILVWQDFMFACAMYPGDSAFVENVKEEITQQVTRLQYHPCIALWSGNNEIDEGWQNWGWQKQYKYSKQDSTKIWEDYKNLFQNIIPTITKTVSPQIPYWASSPSIGWGHKESLLQGDSHYWGVWWGMEPFEVYTKKVGRFMSEYGFQGMPNINTFKSFCDTNELTLNSKSVLAHQKHPTGYQTIQTYMERDYKIPQNFEDYIYVSQLLQRDGMKIAIEAHHRAKPYCMGSLYWQLNDCWPGTSWSAIDYNDHPKALYYETKKLFKDLTISVHPNRNEYEIYIVSDKQNTIKGDLEISIKNMKGEILFQKSDTITIIANESKVHFTIHESHLQAFNKNEVYVSCQLKNSANELLAKTIYCFVKPKELKLQNSEIKIELSKTKNSLLITSKTFVKDLYLYSNHHEMTFSDNFFDLEPNQVIEIKSELGIKLYTEIKYISLFNINN